MLEGKATKKHLMVLGYSFTFILLPEGWNYYKCMPNSSGYALDSHLLSKLYILDPLKHNQINLVN